jgi:hypothetical protein
MGERRIKPAPNGPIFQETKLRWVVSGPTQIYNHKVEPLNNSICYTASIHTNVILENMLPRFWRVEEFEGDNTYTIEEKTCKVFLTKR